MKAAAFDVPVAIFAFNRPNLTRRVFDAVAERRPKRLFLVADGPRPDRSEDNVPCEEVRKILMDVSWPCEVATNFSDGNLGCGRRISSGINWLFKHVDAAILIEDDCLPAPSFFDSGDGRRGAAVGLTTISGSARFRWPVNTGCSRKFLMTRSWRISGILYSRR